MPAPFPLHLIGNAHLDPAWLWPWTDGFAEVLSTFRAALDRLAEYPGFVYTCAGACYYQWVEETAPDMFEEIRKYVREGRLVPVNGWWLQPDCNAPCGESFARHSLYGQRYFLEKFGRACTVGYNVDSFGHNAMLPQILRKSGMDSYVFMRPGPHENAAVPRLFFWESPDGSRVTAFKIFEPYNISSPADFDAAAAKALDAARELGNPMMLFYGVGNHGGGPTISLMNHITRRIETPGNRETFPEGENLLFSSPERYMASVDGKGLPVWRGELQQHAIGCYSAMLTLKQLNRRAETGLLAAEAADALAAMLLGGAPKTGAIADAWKYVMFNQFHDILGGCSIRKACDDAILSYGCAISAAGGIQNSALQRVAWSIDTLGDSNLPNSKEEDWKLWGLADKGTPLVVFNPLPFDATLPAEAAGGIKRVTDSGGNCLDIQRVRGPMTDGENHKWSTLFVARLPALGYATFWLHKNEAGAETAWKGGDCEQHPAPLTTGGGDSLTTGGVSAREAAGNREQVPAPLKSGGNSMSNGFLEVAFDPQSGLISGIKDVLTGAEHLKGPAPAALVIDEAHGDTWGHGLREYRDVAGRFEKVSAEWTERGPLRATMRGSFAYGGSTLVQDVSLYRDFGYIDISLTINWRERHKLLKAEFPVNAGEAAAEVTAEIPYGFVSRGMDGREYPIQRWIDVSGGGRGLTVANDSSFAADVLDGALRVTVLRSPIYADHYGKRDELCEFTEQGERKVRFRLIPHAAGPQSAGAVNAAMELNAPPTLVYASYHKGPLPLRGKGIDISAPNVLAAALKGSEDAGGWILRCYEARGTAAKAEISLPYLQRTFTADFGPCEIKTFLIPASASEPVRETDLPESAGKIWIKRLSPGDGLWNRVIGYAQNCSWGAGPILAARMRENGFTDWESVFAALGGDGQIAGFCTLEKKDIFPELPYTPYIGFVFVGEAYRGKRLSQRLCGEAIAYAGELGFGKVYVGSGHAGLYEKYGFAKIGGKMAPWGEMQGLYEYDMER
ncbi:MAG: GNAT family N-acetyltransferase [Firmicutes bacterium]|nr:GNAT family N-acetyltransferase [Bacillota bacterium]